VFEERDETQIFISLGYYALPVNRPSKKREHCLFKRSRLPGVRVLTASTSALAQYLIGWRGYFGFSQTPRVRRRLRSYLWRQWRNGHNRFTELRHRGVSKFHAAVAASSPTGRWRMSSHPAVQKALRNHAFDDLGLPRLYVAAGANPVEPPSYGPVCPAVWEERRREASPYPDPRPCSDPSRNAREGSVSTCAPSPSLLQQSGD